MDDFERDFLHELLNGSSPRERWLRQNHITDWPEECVPVIKLLYCTMGNCRIALTLGIPKNEAAAWACYVGGRAFEGFFYGEAEVSDMAAVSWILEHETCCLHQAIWELKYSDYYPEADRRGLSQPKEYLARLFVGRPQFHPDPLVRCEGTIPPSVRRQQRIVFRHGC